MQLTRDIALKSEQSALLYIDVQNFCARRNGGEFEGISEHEIEKKYGWYFNKLETETLPKMRKLQTAFRNTGIEVMYTTIESLTKDGRDRSLDYKITGFNVSKGSWDGQVIEAIAPSDDEIVFPKSSSSVFVSTHIDYVLRNLGVKQLAIAGLLTDQCVESAIRDACDLGYLVTQITDACQSNSQERHDRSLENISGYCRQVNTEQLIAELKTLR